MLCRRMRMLWTGPYRAVHVNVLQKERANDGEGRAAGGLARLGHGRALLGLLEAHAAVDEEHLAQDGGVGGLGVDRVKLAGGHVRQRALGAAAGHVERQAAYVVRAQHLGCTVSSGGGREAAY